MLRSEVLPAPFGPITETSSARPTSRSTPLTAWTPPNDLETPWTLSWALIGPPERRPPPRRAPPARGGRRPRRPASGDPRIAGAASREPSLAAPVVLDVAVAPAPTDAGEAEIELLDVLVDPELLGVPVEHDAPALHDVPVLHDPQRHRRILLGEEDRDLLLAVQAQHDVEDLAHEERGQAHRGLVEQHQPGPRHQGAPDRDHLLLAARDVARLDRPALAEPRKVLIDALEVPAGADAGVGVGAREQILLDREVLEDAAPLQDLHDARAHEVGGVAAVDALPAELDGALGDLAPLGVQQIGDRLERGRLAGAVGPEEGDDAPRGALERHPLEHQDHVVVDDLDVVDAQQGGGRRHLLLALVRAGLLGGHPHLVGHDARLGLDPVGDGAPLLAVPLEERDARDAAVIVGCGPDLGHEAVGAQRLEPRPSDVEVGQAVLHPLARQRLALRFDGDAHGLGEDDSVDDAAVVVDRADPVLLDVATARALDV